MIIKKQNKATTEKKNSGQFSIVYTLLTTAV